MKCSSFAVALAAAFAFHAASFTAHAQSGPRAYCANGQNTTTCGPSGLGLSSSCANSGCHTRNPLNDAQRVMKAAGSVSAILNSPNAGMQAILSLYTEQELQAIADWLLTLATVPAPSCTVSASNSSPATGSTITLTASCTNGPTSYTWTNCTSTSSTCQASSATAGSQTYGVVAGNGGGSSPQASVTVTWSAGGGGTPPPPPPTPTPTPTPTATVVEYYHPTLDHYFVTSDAGEAAFIDSGGAGAEWRRTGYQLTVGTSATSANVRPLCRFYGSMHPGPNSHFYTLSPGECEHLKQLQASTPATEPRWNYEGFAFLAGVASTNGQCLDPNYRVPVQRLYNDGFSKGKDSNHRYTTRSDVVTEMVNRGWKPEGVVFCAMQ